MVVNDELLLRVLQACADAAPAPLFPADFAGLDRPTLDAALDRLRLNGLVKIDDWAQGKGQGYKATAAGAEALHKQRIAPAPPPEEAAPDPAETHYQRGEQARAALLEPRPALVTRTLIFANLAVFVGGMWLAWHSGEGVREYVVNGHNQLLFAYAGVNGPRVVYLQEFHRLLSHQFVHVNIVHLVLNMYALFSLGQILESLWGAKRFLCLYLISGWVGGCAVLLTDRAAVGASGAISGLLLSFAVWVWLNREHLPDDVRAFWGRNIAVNLVLLVAISFYFPRVSWEAHLGGAVGGALVSFPLHLLQPGTLLRRAVGVLGVALVPALGLAVGLAPYWTSLTAPARLRAPLLELDSWLLEQHQKIVIPLLRQAKAATHDAEFLAAARAASQEGSTRLQPILDELKRSMPEPESQLKNEMRQTMLYLHTWKALLERVNHFADRPQSWSAARSRLLQDLSNALMQLRAVLEQNGRMPALPPLEPNEPPPNAAPANIA